MRRSGYAFHHQHQQQNGSFAATHCHQVAGLLDQGSLITGGGGCREIATWHGHGGGFVIPNRALIIKNGSDGLLFNTSSATMRGSEFGAFGEVWGPPLATVRTEEMRFEQRSWAGDGFFVDGFNNGNVNRNGFTRVEWISKGF